MYLLGPRVRTRERGNTRESERAKGGWGGHHCYLFVLVRARLLAGIAAMLALVLLAPLLGFGARFRVTVKHTMTI